MVDHVTVDTVSVLCHSTVGYSSLIFPNSSVFEWSGAKDCGIDMVRFVRSYFFRLRPEILLSIFSLATVKRMSVLKSYIPS